MDIWKEKLGISKPYLACKRTAICCQTATCVFPWQKLASAKDNPELKDFFNIFIPYLSHQKVKENFSEAYEACMDIAESRDNIDKNDIYFYHCRFLKPPAECLIYEDRPDLCRNYPDSPFDSIPTTCGYYTWAKQCRKKVIDLQLELINVKFKQFSNYKIFVISPVSSWLK